MKKTRLGIVYVEGDDLRAEFPAQMQEMAERIDELIGGLQARIDRLEEMVRGAEGKYPGDRDVCGLYGQPGDTGGL